MGCKMSFSNCSVTADAVAAMTSMLLLLLLKMQRLMLKLPPVLLLPLLLARINRKLGPIGIGKCRTYRYNSSGPKVPDEQSTRRRSLRWQLLPQGRILGLGGVSTTR
jgi:hypothetical protein